MNEKFLDIGVEAEFVNALEGIGITEPTLIQQQAIPEALKGKNIIGQSATGTGKTFAYLLPILQKLDLTSNAVQAVILAPTYELAMQIFHQTELLIKSSGKNISCASLIGGANINRQIDKLKKKPQVIVGSAGRIMELCKKGKLKLDRVNTLVLDEVDKLLDDQNMKSVKQVQQEIKKECQYLLFSATISPRTINRAEFVTDPVVISLKNEIVLKPNIENLYFIAEFRDKIDVLRKLAAILKVNRGLVFLNRNDNVLKALEKLKFHGVKVTALNSGAGKVERKKAIDDFSKGKVQFLIASDVAARGLDIADIDYVFNLDLPEDEKVYLHRVGRTGRAGKAGFAVSLVDPKEVMKLSEFAKKIKIELKPKRMVNGTVVDFLPRERKTVAPKKIKNDNKNDNLVKIKNNQGKKRF